MFAPFGILVLLATTPTAEPEITMDLRKGCEQVAAETFRRETPHNEDRVDYRAHYKSV
jgi:hypothetical protein